MCYEKCAKSCTVFKKTFKITNQQLYTSCTYLVFYPSDVIAPLRAGTVHNFVQGIKPQVGNCFYFISLVYLPLDRLQKKTSRTL